MSNLTLAEKIVAWYEANKWPIDRRPNAPNIVYIEGADADGKPNADQIDRWNDRRIVFTFNDKGEPEIVLNEQATTEPGLRPTLNPRIPAGVARIPFGYHRVWRMGFHKFKRIGFRHPALVQTEPLKVHRDNNRDGKRTGDLLDWASGINQHGVLNDTQPERVGNHSEGCAVGFLWAKHLYFIALCKQHPDYIADEDYLFGSGFINGDVFGKFDPLKAKR